MNYARDKSSIAYRVLGSSSNVGSVFAILQGMKVFFREPVSNKNQRRRQRLVEGHGQRTNIY
jgi:hypothetical protein